MLIFTIPIPYSPWNSSQSNKARGEKGIQNGKVELILSLLANNLILYLEEQKTPQKVSRAHRLIQ